MDQRRESPVTLLPPDRLSSYRDLLEGCKRYLALEKRDPWYGLARSVVEELWESEGRSRPRVSG